MWWLQSASPNILVAFTACQFLAHLFISCVALLLHRPLQESRGAHAREDFPNRDDKEWMKHTLGWFDYNGAVKDRVKIGYRPVHMQPLDSEMEHIPPKARVY